jgi:arylsulfate sulfotransferase
MKRGRKGFLYPAALLAALCPPASATVQIVSVTPSAKPPQVIGTPITWTVKATDSNPGPLTFQFNVAPPGGSLALVKDFNAGTLSAGTWTSQPWLWAPTGIEGTYQIQVVIKDFTSGETAAFNGNFQVNPLVTGTTPVVVPTANPLVALFSAPSCASGSSMRVEYQRVGSAAISSTSWVKCHPPATMTFEVAGMYASTTYNVFSQTRVGTGHPTNGPTVSFTTGALPTNIPFPTFKVNIPAGPQTDKKDSVLLHSPHRFGAGAVYPMVATDLSGKIIWYYYPNPPVNLILTRPLPGGIMFMIEDGPAWNPATQSQQLLRQIDLAGNIVRETNTGVIQQQLLSMGVSNAGPCNAVPRPAPVGSACLGSFHHDAIQTLPNGDVAVLVDIEKIFPPGTQGNTSGLPVDIVGDMIVVLNSNWQAIWSFDTFQHDSGPPQLDINRAPILGETCGINQPGCPPMLLLGPGIAPLANDWLHANSVYYWPQNGDIVLSARNQDWVMKVDYNNGAGTGNILWRMGPSGDFTFNNIYNDPWPWFSGQHEVDFENNGAGPMTLFDNGNTRIAPPPLGLGSGNSRGMALTVDETTMQLTPVLSVDLGVYSPALGSAQLLSNGNYFFLAGEIFVSLNTQVSNCIEILPTAGTDTGTQVLNMQGAQGYRAWQMASLYAPPIT